MNFLKNLFGTKKLDGAALAQSSKMSDYAQLEFLSFFAVPSAAHDGLLRQRWERVLPHGYDETLELLQKQGWIESAAAGYQMTETGSAFVTLYHARLEREKAEVMPKVHAALAERDTGEALNIRRAYEEKQPLGTVSWSGPEPQMSHSALTRRILFLDHWLLDGLSEPTVEWLKLYSAEQHLWGTYWRLGMPNIPQRVAEELSTNAMNVVEAAYWKAYQLALYVDNQETWQRCKGGDHVRRIEVVGPNDEHTCSHCQESLGEQFLVVRVPELPHTECTSSRGCRCRYEPVLESYTDLAP